MTREPPERRTNTRRLTEAPTLASKNAHRPHLGLLSSARDFTTSEPRAFTSLESVEMSIDVQS